MRVCLLICLVLAGCEQRDLPYDDLPMVDRATHCPARDAVDCATDVGGTYPLEVRGSTAGNPDRYTNTSCTRGGGVTIEDAAYRWTAPWSGRFRFTTEGSGFDTVLSLRQGSCAGRELACSDDVDEGVRHSEIIVNLAECQTVTLVIEGANVDAVGSYVLSVGGFETRCDDGLDDDQDGRIDCDDPDCFTARCADPSDEWPASLTADEWAVLEETNRMRALGATCGTERFEPAEPLTMEPLLRLAARLHSTNMATTPFFDHTDPEGRGPGQRVAEVGFRGSLIGENIARGQPTAVDVVAAWMSSVGHCQNIMNPRYHFLGVGLARSDAGEPYWTQKFAGSDR